MLTDLICRPSLTVPKRHSCETSRIVHKDSIEVQLADLVMSILELLRELVAMDFACEICIVTVLVLVAVLL